MAEVIARQQMDLPQPSERHAWRFGLARQAERVNASIATRPSA
jgi:hypothetical protein